mgnify:CR=1 FL=1
MSKTGSRAQVFHGNADKTTGGLKKADLKQNENGKIVSKKASTAAKKTKNLGKFQATGKGFALAPKKGTKAHKDLKSGKNSRKSSRKSRKSARKPRKSATKPRKSATKPRKSKKKSRK